MKPKHVYVVLNTGRDTIQIVGCFYSKKQAEQWAGNSNTIVVHKLAVA